MARTSVLLIGAILSAGAAFAVDPPAQPPGQAPEGSKKPPATSEGAPEAPQQPPLAQKTAPGAPQIALPVGQADKSWVRLSPKHDIWIDARQKLVIVDGVVCLREGALEMFACPRQTKEHESIVALNSKAWLVHAGLLAIGAKSGKPVSFDPEYRTATGAEIAVTVQWDDKGEIKRVPAQQWIRNAETGKALTHPWVFGGSAFYKSPAGEEIYLGEDGDLICVSNFTTATLDLPIKSSTDASGLVFEAFTEQIPPVDTKVRLVLRVAGEGASKKAGGEKAGGEKAGGEKAGGEKAGKAPENEKGVEEKKAEAGDAGGDAADQ